MERFFEALCLLAIGTIGIFLIVELSFDFWSDIKGKRFLMPETIKEHRLQSELSKCRDKGGRFIIKVRPNRFIYECQK